MCYVYSAHDASTCSFKMYNIVGMVIFDAYVGLAMMTNDDSCERTCRLVGYDNSVVWVSFILNTIFTQHGLMGYVRDDIKLFKSFCRQTLARTNTPTRTIKFKLKIFGRIDLRCLNVLSLCLYSSFNLAFKSFVVVDLKDIWSILC